MRRTLSVGLIAGCLAGIAPARGGDGTLPAIILSRETTYVTSPLTPDGLPDYGTFLDQRGDAGIALADNAAPAVLEVVGIEIDAGTRKRLELPPSDPLGPRLVRSPFAGSRVWAEERARRGVAVPDADEVIRTFLAERPRASAGPWEPEEAPLVAEWLADNDEAIDALAEAVSRRGYWWPRWDPGLAVGPFPSLLGLRDAASALAWRGSLRAGTGRGPEAVDDLVASVRLGCLVARGGTLLEGLLGAALRGIATETLVAVVPHLHRRDAETLLGGLSDLPEIPSAEWHVEGERVFQLGMALELRRLGATRGTRAWKRYLDVEYLREAPAGVYDVDPLAADWNEVLRLVNRTYDGDLEARGTGSTALIREGVGVFDPTGSRRCLERAAISLERARGAVRHAAGVDEPPVP